MAVKKQGAHEQGAGSRGKRVGSKERTSSWFRLTTYDLRLKP
ncbi:hypothetical protein [Chroococcidiopsis sp.]